MSYIQFLVPLVLIVAAVAIAFLGPFMGAGILLAVPFLPLLLSHPGATLGCYLALASVQSLLQMLGIPLVSYADEALVVVMVVVLGARFAMRRRLAPQLNAFYLLSAASFLVIGLSFLVNRPSPIQAVHFTFTYFRFIPVFILAYLFWNTRSTMRLLVTFNLGFIVIQFVLSVLWMLGVNPIPNPKNWYDVAIGTLGSCAYVAYYSVGFLAVVLARISKIDRLGDFLLAVFWAIFAVVLLLLTLTMHAYILGACVFVWWFLRQLRLRAIGLGTVGISLSLAAAVVALLLLSSQHYAETIRFSLTPEHVLRRVRQVRYEPKGIVYENVLRYAPKDLRMPAVGAGPGNFASVVGIEHDTHLVRKYVTYFFDSYVSRELLRSGSISAYPFAGFLSIYGDIGPVGAAFYYGFYILAFLRIRRQLRAGAYRETWRSVAAEAFLPICTVWVAISFAWDAFHIDYLSAMVWMLAAIAWTPGGSVPSSTPGSDPVPLPVGSR